MTYDRVRRTQFETTRLLPQLLDWLPQVHGGLPELLHVPRSTETEAESGGSETRCNAVGRTAQGQKAAAEAGEYKTVFACSYSDFFMQEADQWRDEAWAIIRATPNLIWQLTSKRTHLIADRLPPDWSMVIPMSGWAPRWK